MTDATQQPDWADEALARCIKWLRYFDYSIIPALSPYAQKRLAAMIREARPDASPAVAFTREDVLRVMESAVTVQRWGDPGLSMLLRDLAARIERSIAGEGKG